MTQPKFESDPIHGYFTGLQDRIVACLETIERAPFRRDAWTRDKGGGGVARLIEQGNVLERGGVMFSHVTGDQLPVSASAYRAELAGRAWQAMGVSLVLHPRNPYAPTVHLNVRFFIAQKADAERVIRELESAGTFDGPLVTQVVPADTFYPAEQYHQDYYRNNPDKAYCRAMITPKVAKLRLKYADRLAATAPR